MLVAADPCKAVAAAAATALGSICAHCGYGSLRDLVARNGDYVVDGVCRQLRLLDAYPRQAWHLYVPGAASLRRDDICSESHSAGSSRSMQRAPWCRGTDVKLV